MHFQIYRDDYYKQLIADLKKQIPEFTSVFDDDEGIYPVMGEFARFVMANINNEELLQKCLGFLNHSLQKGGYDTEDVIKSEVFEQFILNVQLVNLCNEELQNKALKIFQKLLTEKSE